MEVQSWVNLDMKEFTLRNGDIRLRKLDINRDRACELKESCSTNLSLIEKERDLNSRLKKEWSEFFSFVWRNNGFPPKEWVVQTERFSWNAEFWNIFWWQYDYILIGYENVCNDVRRSDRDRWFVE